MARTKHSLRRRETNTTRRHSKPAQSSSPKTPATPKLTRANATLGIPSPARKTLITPKLTRANATLGLPLTARKGTPGTPKRVPSVNLPGRLTASARKATGLSPKKTALEMELELMADQANIARRMALKRTSPKAARSAATISKKLPRRENYLDRIIASYKNATPVVIKGRGGRGTKPLIAVFPAPIGPKYYLVENATKAFAVDAVASRIKPGTAGTPFELVLITDVEGRNSGQTNHKTSHVRLVTDVGFRPDTSQRAKRGGLLPVKSVHHHLLSRKPEGRTEPHQPIVRLKM